MREPCGCPFASSHHDDLTILLPVSSIGERSYRSCVVQPESRSMSGAGLMAGQGVWAAAQSVEKMHVRALKLGISGEPRLEERLEYAVESASAEAGKLRRDVYAVQGMDMLGRMHVTFAESKSFLMTPPSMCMKNTLGSEVAGGSVSMDMTQHHGSCMPYAEIRQWAVTTPGAMESGVARLRVWYRLRHPLPARGAWSPAALTYVAISHMPAAFDACRTPADAGNFGPGTYEFSMLFHSASFDVNDWMLLDSKIIRPTTEEYAVETNIFSRTGDLLVTSSGKNSRLS